MGRGGCSGQRASRPAPGPGCSRRAGARGLPQKAGPLGAIRAPADEARGMLRPNHAAGTRAKLPGLWEAAKPPDPVPHPLSGCSPSSPCSRPRAPGGSASIPKSPPQDQDVPGGFDKCAHLSSFCSDPWGPAVPTEGAEGHGCVWGHPSHRREQPARLSSAGLAPGPLPNSSPAFLSNEALIGSRLRFPSPLLRALQSQRCRAIKLRFWVFLIWQNYFGRARIVT